MTSCSTEASDGFKRQKFLFINLVAATALFPSIDLLSLYGRFDSMIAWYSHGEVHSLTKQQRTLLRKQLLVQTLLYSVFAIVLAIYYVAGGF